VLSIVKKNESLYNSYVLYFRFLKHLNKIIVCIHIIINAHNGWTIYGKIQSDCRYD